MIEFIQDNSLHWLANADEKIADLIYMDPPFKTGRDFGEFKDFSDLNVYMDWIKLFILHSSFALKDTGSFIIHTDWRTSHYLRVFADSVFGYDRCINEIIWSYNSGGASKRHLSKKHDTLLWYTKSDAYTFNVLREPYATPGVEDRKGFHPDGRMLTDVWQIPFLSTTSKERTGYPTQKPLALAKRIVEVFTNPGDVVVDPFCGSGTMGEACALLNRSAFLIDENPKAIALARKRV